MSRAAPNFRPDDDPGPIEADDVVRVQLVGGDTTFGIVQGEDEHHTSRNRVLVATKDHDRPLNTERDRCEQITGARADTVRTVLEGERA